MKTSLVLATLTLASQAHAAASYRFPVERIEEFTPEVAEKLSKDELKKMDTLSTFPVDVFEVKTGEKGSIKYQLPTVLTGKKVVILMDKVADDDGLRVYQAADGTGASTCTGPEAKPTCSIEVENLNLKEPQNIQLRNKNIAATYSTQADRQRVELMADLFSDQIPIGIMRAENMPTYKSLQGRFWHGSYTVNGKPVEYDLCFYQGNDQLLGQYRVGMPFKANVPCGQCPTSNNGFCGTIEQLNVKDKVITGQWRASTSKGWVTFNFDESLNFKGNYGTEGSKQSQGSWDGRLR